MTFIIKSLWSALNGWDLVMMSIRKHLQTSIKILCGIFIENCMKVHMCTKKKFRRLIAKAAKHFWQIVSYWENVLNAEVIPEVINVIPAERF